MSGRRSTKKGGGNRWAKANATLNAAKKVPVDQKPPNHPQENLPEHRTFLARSLRRNDEDMAALVDLNRSLEKVKDNLVEVCGEDVLLDLGEGIFQLTPCERDLMVTPAIPRAASDNSPYERIKAKHKQQTLQDKLGTIDDASKLLCVDFLLRMKLRRRLLNRLARRLMRVAHAMDGEDVTAPAPPKYGDLRLHLDPQDMAAAKRQWEVQEEARQRVAEFRRTQPNSWLPWNGQDEDEEEEEVGVVEEEKTEVPLVEPVKSEENAPAIESTEKATGTENKQEESKVATKKSEDVVVEDSDKTTDKKESEDVEMKDAHETKKEEAEKPVAVEEPKSAQIDEKEMDGEKPASEEAKKVDAKEKAMSNEKETPKEGEQQPPSTPLTSPSKVSSDAAEALLSIMSSPSKSPTTEAAEAKEENDKVATAPALPGVGEKDDMAANAKGVVISSSPAATTDDKIVAPKEEEPKGVAAATEEEKAVDNMETDKTLSKDKLEEDAKKDGSELPPVDNTSEKPKEDTEDKMDVDVEVKSTEKETSVKTDGNSETAEAAESGTKSIGDDPAEKKEEEPTSASTSKEDGAKTVDGANATSTPQPKGAVSTPVKAKPEMEAPTSNTTKAVKEPPSPAVKLLIEVPPPRELSQLEKDYEILKDFVDTYEKNIDPVTGEVSFPALTEEEGREEDYAAINRGVGIGAANQKMSLKEKEMEFQRWQSAVLGRIPEAPTLDEIGMKNCVFRLEERRKRVRLQKEEQERETKRRRREERGDDVSRSDDEEESKPVKRNIGAVERKSPSKKSKEEEEEKLGVTKLKKPLPLVPYPSFYESDLRRIRLVHFDLMSHSIRASAQQRVQAVTAEYNAALRTSTSYFERKHKLENQLAQLAAHYRNEIGKIKHEWSAKATHEKRRWLHQKAEYDANRLKKFMPTNWNAIPTGTRFTKAVVQKYREGTIPHVVGTCVADIVDAIEIKQSGSVRDEPFAPFRVPPQPTFETYVVDQNTGETMAQHAQRNQRTFQQELQAVQVKLGAAEEERKRAWKKLMKVKAELEQVNGKSGGAITSFTPKSRTSRGIEGYAPSGGVNTSDSKYSRQRVRQRIGTDGSVEPISKKIGSDGQYQRPTGRGRKGMDWDAVRGVWISTD